MNTVSPNEANKINFREGVHALSNCFSRNQLLATSDLRKRPGNSDVDSYGNSDVFGEGPFVCVP